MYNKNTMNKKERAFFAKQGKKARFFRVLKKKQEVYLWKKAAPCKGERDTKASRCILVRYGYK